MKKNRRGVLDIRGRRDFSRFDPSPAGRPHFSNSGPPVERICPYLAVSGYSRI